jgi:diguanylate cyclase (GGDEF)-like protein
MDVLASVLDQMDSFLVCAVRIVDPETNRVVREKRSDSFQGRFPDLTLSQTRNYLSLCISGRQPVFHFIHKGNRILLLLAAPFQLSGKTMLSETVMDATGRIFLNGVDLNGEKGLLNRIRQTRAQAVTDELTGLYNRRYIDEHLPSEIHACMEKRHPLSVIFADLDFYKNVNDVFGHTAGDRVLREFAELLTGNIRKEKDWAARYGGEEFLIFLNNRGYQRSKEIAERIRIAVMDHTFYHDGRAIKITCSFGVLTVDDFSGCPTAEEILDAVDKRLYRAKKLGRNTVV